MGLAARGGDDRGGEGGAAIAARSQGQWVATVTVSPKSFGTSCPRMNTAITTTNHAKPFRRRSAGMRLTRRPPITLPTIAAATTAPAVSQGIVTLDRYPAKPAKDFIVMTRSEVPTAAPIGSPPRRTSAGTTRKPPPAPTRPVTPPTTRPSASTFGRGSSAGSAAPSAAPALRPRIIATAVTSIIAPKRRSSTLAGMNFATRPAAYAPAMLAAPKMAPVFQRTRPARAWGMSAAALVEPTTSSEVAMATRGGSWNTYRRIGTVRIDPPPPRSPRDMPMRSAKRTPTSSMADTDLSSPAQCDRRATAELRRSGDPLKQCETRAALA